MATERPAKAKRILVVEDEPIQHVNGCGRGILRTKNDDWLGCLCMSNNTAERAHEQGGRALCLKRKPKKSASRKM